MSDGLPGDETVPVAGGPSSTVVLENTPKATHWCSFCSKSNNEVKLIITGEAGACICDECIELCRDIIGSARVAIDKMFSNGKVEGAEGCLQPQAPSPTQGSASPSCGD